MSSLTTQSLHLNGKLFTCAIPPGADREQRYDLIHALVKCIPLFTGFPSLVQYVSVGIESARHAKFP